MTRSHASTVTMPSTATRPVQTDATGDQCIDCPTVYPATIAVIIEAIMLTPMLIARRSVAFSDKSRASSRSAFIPTI